MSHFEADSLLTPDSPRVDDVAPSPNFGDRRGKAIDAVILHYTGMQSGEAAQAWLCNPASGVSCHYLVWEDGRVTQLVAEDDRAWHAGIGQWAGDGDMNSVSIGIEIVNFGHQGGLPPYPAAQVEAVAALCADICARRAIAARRVLGHSDMAPGRKIDPGEHFPWQALAAAGVGLWLGAPPPPGEPELGQGDKGDRVRDLQRRLAAMGYACAETGTYDDATALVVAAFQRHWRPARVDGRADHSTLTVLTSAWDIVPQNLRPG